MTSQPNAVYITKTCIPVQKSDGIVTCRSVRVTILTGFRSDDWIYWLFGYSRSSLQLIQLVLKSHKVLSLIYIIYSSP
jgi:hypothetical protein